MGDSIRYGKPNMANLPADYEKMREEAVQLEREMIKARKQKDDKGTSTD